MSWIYKQYFNLEPKCALCMLSFSGGQDLQGETVIKCAALGSRPKCPEIGRRKDCPLKKSEEGENYFKNI